MLNYRQFQGNYQGNYQQFQGNYQQFKKEYFEFLNSVNTLVKIKTKRSYIDRLSSELGTSPGNICIGYEKCLFDDFVVFKKTGSF